MQFRLKTKMSQLSREDLSFVEELPQHVDIDCPICLYILKDPHQVTCCGNNFCEKCIKRVRAQNGACPLCKNNSYQSFPDKKCLRVINGLSVSCSNQKKGCQWKGSLKNLFSHLNEGEKEGECQYEEIRCRYDKCRKIFLRSSIKIHENKDCHQRPYKCRYCLETKGTYLFITTEHYKSCSGYPIHCPNKCSQSLITRGNLARHLSVCVLEPVDCSFSWAGCKYKPLRKDMSAHTTDAKHLALLAVACGQLKKENEDLKREVEQQKKTCEQLENDANQLNIKVEKLASTCVDSTTQTFEIPAGSTYPILPISITKDSNVTHFFTDEYREHLMSIKAVRLNSLSYKLLLAYHGGKTFWSLPHISAKYGDTTVTLLDNTKALILFKSPHGVLQEDSIALPPPPPGVLVTDIILKTYTPLPEFFIFKQ